MRRLLGSPALVQTLKGVEKRIAVAGYIGSLKQLFVAGTGLALIMVLIQAATGWQGAEEIEEGGETEHLIDVDDEEWEEGMEQGV